MMKKTLGVFLLLCLLLSGPEIRAAVELATGPVQELPAWPLGLSDHGQPYKVSKRLLTHLAPPPEQFSLPCLAQSGLELHGLPPDGARRQALPLYALLSSYRI